MFVNCTDCGASRAGICVKWSDRDCDVAGGSTSYVVSGFTILGCSVAYVLSNTWGGEELRRAKNFLKAKMFA